MQSQPNPCNFLSLIFLHDFYNLQPRLLKFKHVSLTSNFFKHFCSHHNHVLYGETAEECYIFVGTTPYTHYHTKQRFHIATWKILRFLHVIVVSRWKWIRIGNFFFCTCIFILVRLTYYIQMPEINKSVHGRANECVEIISNQNLTCMQKHFLEFQ